MPYKRKLGHRVKPLKTATIEAAARRCRDSFKQAKPYINICNLIEALREMKVLDFTVVEDSELGDEEARTYPNDKHIVISNSVYEAAADGEGRARFTIAHELGHLDLHKNQKPMFSRGDHKIFEDSEWQADTFASEFLMDSRLIKPNHTIEDVMRLFGVSRTAAGLKLKKLRQ